MPGSGGLFPAPGICPPAGKAQRVLSWAISAGQQVIAEQRRRLADLKQKAAAEAQSQWEARHGQPPFPPSCSPLMPHSILHHHPPGRREDPEHAYDTLSLESSDSLDTNLSTSGASACSPDNASRYRPAAGMGQGGLPGRAAGSLASPQRDARPPPPPTLSRGRASRRVEELPSGPQEPPESCEYPSPPSTHPPTAPSHVALWARAWLLCCLCSVWEASGGRALCCWEGLGLRGGLFPGGGTWPPCCSGSVGGGGLTAWPGLALQCQWGGCRED